VTFPSRLGLTGAAGVLAVTASLAASHPAAAAAGGCSGPAVDPQVCVGVRGSGTHVTDVDGGVVLRARQSVTGHWTIRSTDRSIDVTTPTKTYANQSYYHGQSYNSGWYPIDRDLPSGTRVCAAFSTSTGPVGTACDTVRA
jgi:hypothetical protein